MCKKPGLVLIFLLMYCGIAFSQIPTQTISGQIFDAVSLQPLVSANITVKNPDHTFGAITDEQGQFSLTDIPIGRYEITISYVGYQSEILKDILLESGKEKVMHIGLKPSAKQLNELEISGKREDLQIKKLDAISFNMEESQRFAATFYDPARMATSFAGVASTNDQGNNISIRGNSPNGILWRLQGIDIVNPNHLTNAGTFSDRPSINGGGVSVLSAQLMEQSHLYKGAFPPSYGNALSGAFDIRLREGNKTKREYTLQAGLLGIEAAAEGPFSKQQNSSYLVNYRYSTIGFLDAIGIPVSKESINFQDLSFNLAFDGKKAGKFTVFGLGGLSSETFHADHDTTTWENEEDRLDTDFKSNMGGIGVTHQLNLGSRTSLKTKLAYSTISSHRKSFWNFVENAGNESDIILQKCQISDDRYTEGLWSFNTELNHQINANNTVQGGIFIDRTNYDLLSMENNYLTEEQQSLADGKSAFLLYQPYFNWSHWLLGHAELDLGIHAMYLNFNHEFSAEPRLGLNYYFDNGDQLNFHYGLVSQLQPPQSYFVTISDSNGNLSYPNHDLGFTKSQQFVLSYSKIFSEFFHFTIQAFFQHHFDVPVSPDPENTYSIVNAEDGFINQILVNKGLARNTGLELTLERSFKHQIYFLANATVYDSKYRAMDEIWRNTRYNGNYLINFTGGKEFEKFTKTKNRTIGLNFRIFYQGGYRNTPIDAAASAMQNSTVFDDSKAFSEKLDDYFRLDFRLYFKRYKPNYTRTFSIDIQNLTNQQNIAYYYFDHFLDKVVTKYQLGIVPYLSYRIEF